MMELGKMQTLEVIKEKDFGVYLAEPVADVIAVIFTAILFFFQFRKALGKLKE